MVAAIANAHAGRRRRRAGARAIARRLGRGAHVVETRSLDELSRAAADTAAASPRLIVVSGGDGTVGATLTALVAAYGDRPLPRLCLLPGGTMNVIARSVGVRGGAGDAIERLAGVLDGRREARTLRRTAIRVGGRVCFLFGIGLLARFLESYNGTVRGRRAFASVFGNAVAGAVVGTFLARGARGPSAGSGSAHPVRRWFSPFEARVTVDGVAWPKTMWTNLSAGGVEGLGFGFRPYLRAGERPGAFHLIGHDLTPLGALAQLPRLRLGRGMRDVSQDLATRVVIEADRAMPWGADGDLFDEADRFELSAGPVLELLVP